MKCACGADWPSAWDITCDPAAYRRWRDAHRAHTGPTDAAATRVASWITPFVADGHVYEGET